MVFCWKDLCRVAVKVTILLSVLFSGSHGTCIRRSWFSCYLDVLCDWLPVGTKVIYSDSSNLHSFSTFPLRPLGSAMKMLFPCFVSHFSLAASSSLAEAACGFLQARREYLDVGTREGLQINSFHFRLLHGSSALFSLLCFFFCKPRWRCVDEVAADDWLWMQHVRIASSDFK